MFIADWQRGQLIFADSVQAAARGARWVQESVPERLDLKAEVLREAALAMAPDAVLASSTSGFRPSALSEAAGTSVLVCHPFNPVYLLPLVEVVGAEGEDAPRVAEAGRILQAVGMYPLAVRREIDAHIADRLLEAVWREALWLVRDGIATTGEVDDAIRYGFGLRWAQMGLFETYRIAGGDAGMGHFLAQFGPALQWPWSRLTDVPELTPELIEQIVSQSDAQAAGASVADLEARRDRNLVALLGALQAEDAAAGALLNRHNRQLRAGDDVVD